MFSISARLEANLDPNDLLAAYGLEKGGRVQRFIDQKADHLNEWLDEARRVMIQGG